MSNDNSNDNSNAVPAAGTSLKVRCSENDKYWFKEGIKFGAGTDISPAKDVADSAMLMVVNDLDDRDRARAQGSNHSNQNLFETPIKSKSKSQTKSKSKSQTSDENKDEGDDDEFALDDNEWNGMNGRKKEEKKKRVYPQSARMLRDSKHHNYNESHLSRGGGGGGGGDDGGSGSGRNTGYNDNGISATAFANMLRKGKSKSKRKIDLKKTLKAMQQGKETSKNDAALVKRVMQQQVDNYDNGENNENGIEKLLENLPQLPAAGNVEVNQMSQNDSSSFDSIQLGSNNQNQNGRGRK